MPPGRRGVGSVVGGSVPGGFVIVETVADVATMPKLCLQNRMLLKKSLKFLDISPENYLKNGSCSD